MKRIKLWGLMTLWCTGLLNGQEVLKLKDAVALSLSHNYQIQIARQDAVIDKTNNTLGNAGFLPQVNLNFGRNLNINNTRQEFFSGDVREGNNVNTNNLNANIQLGWTVFDGLRMFVSRDRLQQIEELGMLALQLQIEQTVFQVMNLYYSIEHETNRKETIQKAIDISRERLELARLKQDVGSGSGIQVLQAEVDIQSDSSMLVRQQLIIRNLKIQLNELLGREPDLDFGVENTEMLQIEDYNSLSDKMKQRNLLLQTNEKNIKLAALNIKMWEANKYPVVDINMGYAFTRLQAEIGILKFNQNAGLSAGITGRWNIFNGWNNKREIQVARLQLDNARLMEEQTNLSLRTDLFTAYSNYLTQLEMERMEEKNIKIARQNLDITTEKMRVGVIDALELRQAQLNLVNAEFRKIDASFEAHVSVLELKRIAGDLIQ